MAKTKNLKLTSMLAGLEDSDGVARTVDVTNAAASATNDHPEAPTGEADSDGVAATAADTVSAGDADGVTPTIQDAINSGKQVGEDITKMEACKASLEHHIGQVTKLIDRNEAVPTSLAKAIQISLQRHDPQFFARTVPSLENFDAPTGRMTVSLELLDKLKAGASAVGKGIFEAVKRFIEALINAWDILSTNRGDLLKRLDAADKIIKSGNIKEGTPISYGGLKALTMNGEVAGASSESVETLLLATEGLMVTWPKRVVILIGQIRDKMKDIDIDNVEQLGGLLTAMFATLGASFKDCFHGLDIVVVRNPAGDSTVKTPVLPGNREVSLTYHNDKLADGQLIVSNLSAALTVKLERAAEATHDGKDIVVPSAEELAAGIQRTRKLLDIGNRRDDVTNELQRTFVEVGGSGENGGKIVQSLAVAALSFTTSYLGYLNTTTKALVGFYENVAATNGKGAK